MPALVWRIALLLDLGGALKIAAYVLLGFAALLILSAMALGSIVGGILGDRAGYDWTAPSAEAVEVIPTDQLAVMQAAAASAPCHLDWTLLAAIARVESGFGSNMATSSAGAIGYGQFLPSTWALPGIGNGGNPYDYRDALPAMARYLCASGVGQDVRRALYAYNHADWYVSLVLEVQGRYAAVAAPPAQPGTSNVVDVAMTWLGTPYGWGRNGPKGPNGAVDCSGLVYETYRAVGVALPRTAQTQYDATQRVGTAELQPGDLVFFGGTDPRVGDRITHVGIYVGGGAMIDAPEENRPVRVESMLGGYWSSHYAGGGRVQWLKPKETPAPQG